MRTTSEWRWRQTVRVFVIGAALFGAGCGANLAPVLNLNHVPLAGTPAGVEPSTYAHEAILRAIRSRGWVGPRCSRGRDGFDPEGREFRDGGHRLHGDRLLHRPQGQLAGAQVR